MKVIYAQENFSPDYNSIFLAGPTPRSPDVKSWRPEAISILKDLGFDGQVYAPEPESGSWEGYEKVEEIEWEEKGLTTAGIIVFWIPREMKTMPGLTTNDEWGTWKNSKKVVFGAPLEAEHVGYQRYYAQKLNVPSFTDLKETLHHAVTTLKSKLKPFRFVENNLTRLVDSLEPYKPFTWLKGRNYSDAFVICVGAGPWRFDRRKKIQGVALEKLAGRDLCKVTEKIDWYPLEWQNKYVNHIISYLGRCGLTMEGLCSRLMLDERKKIYEAAGSPRGAKVLSLFCRDALRIDAFPIDRHVKRFLQDHNLPTTEDDMIKLCDDSDLSSREVATIFVRAASNMDNPDWSIK